MPLMGTGLSKAGLSLQESYDLLTCGLVRNGSKIHGHIHLVRRPEDKKEIEIKEVMDEFDQWAKAEEQKERTVATEIKQSLLNLGATAGDEKPLSDFAVSREKPLTGKDGKTYVAVPSPDRVIPLLKKVVRKMLGAFGWSHDLAEKTKEHVEHARASLKAKLPQKKKEADQMNEARWAAEHQATVQQTEPEQKHKRDETSL